MSQEMAPMIGRFRGLLKRSVPPTDCSGTTGTTVVRLGHVLAFSGFLLLGGLAALAAYSFRNTAGTILVLVAPLAAFWLWAAVGQGTRNITALLKSVVWWQWLWLLLFMSELVFRERTTQEIQETAVDAWAAYRIVLVATTALVLAIRLALRRPAWLGSLFRGFVGALTVYAAIAAASTLWSGHPLWTLYKSLEYLVDVALLAATLATVWSTEEYRTFFNWTWALFGLLVASVWFGVLVWPTLALQPSGGLLPIRLYGIMPAIDSNTLGEFGAILAVVAFSRLLLIERGDRPQRAWYCLVCAVGLVTLVLSQTRSAIGGFLLGVLLVLFFSKGKAITALVVSAGATVLCVGSVTGHLWEAILRGGSEEAFAGASGRVDTWQYTWHEILKSPVLGAGAYSIRFGPLTKLRLSEFTNSLNTYADVSYGVGIVGLIPVLVAFWGTWWFLIRSLRNPSLASPERRLAVEAVGVLSVVSVRSLFTTHLIWHTSLQFLVVLGYTEFLRRQWGQRRGTGVRTLTTIPR